MKRLVLAASVAALALLSACSKPEFPASEQYGYNPKLPEPEQYLVPPMGLAKPVGWAPDAAPKAPAGFVVQRYAENLAGPRRILPLANGDVLVAESGDPGYEPVLRPKDIFFKITLGQVHSDVKPGNRVLLLRDTNGDGRADQQTVLVDHLASPFGLAMIGDTLYVAETDKIDAFPFTPGATKVGPGRVVTDLPGGPIDHHWTKDLTASPDGKYLYAGVGSNSNIVEKGLEAEHGRAAIWQIDPATGAKRLYATGLRNPNGLTFQPGTNELWAVINERDELGNNLVPDYLTSVKEGGFYGWPYSYYGQHVDPRVMPQRPDLVKTAIIPDYSLSSHVAPLGLAFLSGGAFPSQYQGGAFIGEHGSWDREVYNGYAVAFVPFANGRPSGQKQDFLTGFIEENGDTHGRPVGVAFDASGALLVADDIGNVIWRVAPAAR